MPNIMICGFTSLEADDLKVKIDKAMQGIGLAGDAVTSIVNMKVESCDKKKTPTPYLRICSTTTAEISHIIDALRDAKVQVDVEWLKITGFIPAKGMCG